MYGIVWFDKNGNMFPVVNGSNGLKTYTDLLEADHDAECFEKTFGFDCRVISLSGVNE